MGDALGPALVVLALVASWVATRHLLADPRPLTAGPSPGEARVVSVVVPARDEQTSLPALLDSLSRQTAAPAEIVVVDDGSRDATAEVARAAGARVLPAGEPPTGWTGKAWACHVGVGATRGDVLLFLDADTTLAPTALEGLLAARERDGGLVSVAPHHVAVRPHEQLSAYFNLVSVLASGAFARRPHRPPLAFGPCLLSTRADYGRSGGHAAVRHAILDDVMLAAAYDRAGLAVVCHLGGSAVQMRSYPGGVGDLVRGWGKNMASGASAAATGPTLTAVAWVGAHHAAAVGGLVALAEVLTGRAAPGGTPLALGVLAWLVVSLQLRSLLASVGSFRAWTWVLFPLPLLAFDVVLARSAFSTALRRSVRWRGRDVDLRAHGPARGGG